MKKYCLSLFLTILMILLTNYACGPIKGEVQIDTYVLPLTVSVNTDGEIRFEVQSGIKIPTPIGVVTAGVVVDATSHYAVPNTLTVRMDGEDYFFNLHGQDFRLDFQSGYYEEISFRKNGLDLILEIAHEGQASVESITVPVNQRIAPGSRFTVVTILRYEITDTQIRIFYEAKNTGNFTNVVSILEPVPCIREHRSDLMRFIQDRVQEYSPKESSFEFGSSRNELKGDAVFPRSIITENHYYDFEYFCPSSEFAFRLGF